MIEANNQMSASYQPGGQSDGVPGGWDLGDIPSLDSTGEGVDDSLGSVDDAFHTEIPQSYIDPALLGG
jgi:hypothetical protein